MGFPGAYIIHLHIGYGSKLTNKNMLFTHPCRSPSQANRSLYITSLNYEGGT